jgi:D-serine deaminase-like pyridoxal phosphate-dependent protein
MADLLVQPSITQCTTFAGLSAGTTSTISTANTIQYCIRGKAYTPKTAITNGATPTVDSATGLPFVPLLASQGTVVTLGLDASGTLRASQGSVQPLDPSGAFVLAPQFPNQPDTVCVFGYIVVKAGATAVGTWTFGTNNLSSVTGLTFTFTNVMGLPDRPQIA